MTASKPARPGQGRPPALVIICCALFAVMVIGGVARRWNPAQGAKDTVTWVQLKTGSVAVENGAPHASFGKDVDALDGKEICITGYMFPLQGAEDQKHFLLSAYPPTCPFCLPGGPNEMIEVTDTAESIPYSMGQTSLRGTLHLMKTPAQLANGMLYSLSGAAAVKQ